MDARQFKLAIAPLIEEYTQSLIDRGMESWKISRTVKGQATRQAGESTSSVISRATREERRLNDIYD